jgi:exopolysaccharide production protein ExoZ
MKKIWTIQYLRALAALAVVLYHLAYGNGDWFPLGAFGVDIFFVISGFIMWVMTETNRSAHKFVVDRVSRIVPTYWVVTLLSAAGASIKPWVFGILAPSLQGIIFSLLFVPHSSPPVVPQGWTLNLEMFFYAIFAATIFLPRMAQILALSSILGTFGVIGFFMHFTEGIGNAYFNPKLLEFVGGLWLGEFWLRPSCRISGLGAILLGAVATQIGVHIFGWEGAAWIGASVLIVASALIWEGQVQIPKIVPLAVVGDASYIIYLIHTPVVMLIKSQHWLPLPIQIIGAIIISLTAAVLALPFERWLIRHTRIGLNHVSDRGLSCLRKPE